MKLGVQALQRAPQPGFFPGPRGEKFGVLLSMQSICAQHRLLSGGRGLGLLGAGPSPGGLVTMACRAGMPQAARAVVPESNLI